MFLIIPWKTDALVAHRPWGTAGAMTASVVVAWLFGFAGYDTDVWGPPEPLPANRWGLQGDVDPVTWVTHLFVHFGWIHLIGNMLFLWVFGLVVEGAVGWRKFLAIYLGVGAAHGALQQLVLLDPEVIAAGSSAAIFGVMAVAMLWSPLCKITAFIVVLIVPFWNREIRVRSFSLFFLIWEAILVLLSTFAVSSALAHVLGWVMGLPVGILFLRRHWVDCEGWDVFSLRRQRRERLRRHRERQAARAQD